MNWNSFFAGFIGLFVIGGSLGLAQDHGSKHEQLHQDSEKHEQHQSKKKITNVKAVKVGEFKKISKVGDLYLGGQFQQADVQRLKELKIKKVISLRTASEVKWDEAKAVKGAGMKFVRLPFGGLDQLNDKLFDSVRKQLKSTEPMLLHCGSSNRVGGVWLTYRVLDEGANLETALKEAKAVGLKNPKIQAKAIDYIRRKKSTKK